MAKKKTAAKAIVPPERVQQLIVMFRGLKVVLSHDLAELYAVEHRALNQAVQRNRARFPDDFIFQLTSEEFYNLKSQIVISSWGGRRTPPYAFTEQGVVMLSSVLNREQAIAVNIEIMRAFVRGIMGPTVRAQLAENPNRQLAVECHDTQPGDSKQSVWVPGRCAAAGCVSRDASVRLSRRLAADSVHGGR